MAKRVVQRKRKIESGTKVKTGCGTCRIRKIKCDENKPSCHRCVSTGRTCEGYESPFRIVNCQTIENARPISIASNGVPQLISLNSDEVSTKDIDFLSRYFSTKTMFDVKLGCEEAARQVLQASRTEVPLRYAVWSLRALREDREMCEDGPVFGYAQQTASYDYGVRLYSMALGGLASKLSSPGSRELRSALLCCQIFISIEQVRENYAILGQHLIRGLRIMHAYHARPGLTARNKLVPAHPEQLPLLDVFVIKLFAAPCKFVERQMASLNESTPLACSILLDQRSSKLRDHRAIAPDRRAELIRIAASTLKFLTNVSRVESVDEAVQMLSEKVTLLEALESWIIGLDHAHTQNNHHNSEPLSMSFMRLFHIILKVVLLGALDSSSSVSALLQTANDQLQSMANSVNDRVRVYRTCA